MILLPPHNAQLRRNEHKLQSLVLDFDGCHRTCLQSTKRKQAQLVQQMQRTTRYPAASQSQQTHVKHISISTYHDKVHDKCCLRVGWRILCWPSVSVGTCVAMHPVRRYVRSMLRLVYTCRTVDVHLIRSRAACGSDVRDVQGDAANATCELSIVKAVGCQSSAVP